MGQFGRAFAQLVLVLFMLHLPAEASEEKCVGPRDGQDLATTAIRVAAGKREAFLTAVRAFGSARSMGVGGATDSKGWVVVLLESRPWGVSIEVEAMDADNFRAIARTCNATEDWRPYWDSFKQFIDANRGQWV